MNLEKYNSNRPYREVRAVYDDETIRVYQAFGTYIAGPALEAQTFVEPFLFEGITSWIKPSFLWTMTRTGWGNHTRKGKGTFEHEGNAVVLGIDVKREFFDRVLSEAQITHYEEQKDKDKTRWGNLLRNAKAVVQWDPEKTLEGAKRPYRAIQIGLRTPFLEEYATSIVRIEDMKEFMEKIQSEGSAEGKVALLPDEEPYHVNDETVNRLHMRKKH